jgi:hypothetical protein
MRYSVLIIERGGSVHKNPLVYDTRAYGAAFGTPIDYAYQSAPQTYMGNKVETLRAGKALGGTTTINGMSYTRAEDIQIDAWQRIGSWGWTWEILLPYYCPLYIQYVPIIQFYIYCYPRSPCLLKVYTEVFGPRGDGFCTHKTVVLCEELLSRATHSVG